RRFGLTLNIMKHIDLAQVMNEVAYKTVLSTAEIQSMVGMLGRRLIRARDVVAIAVKPFMDRFNYDQDRISSCCHHLLNRDGMPVSFCEYNARLRQQDTWEKFPV